MGHQWWGHQVWNDNDYHYWFVESFSEMSAAMYLYAAQDSNPKKASKAYMDKVNSWKADAFEANKDVSVQDIWRATTSMTRGSMGASGTS